jgi:hypothetical protein
VVVFCHVVEVVVFFIAVDLEWINFPHDFCRMVVIIDLILDQLAISLDERLFLELAPLQLLFLNISTLWFGFLDDILLVEDLIS